MRIIVTTVYEDIDEEWLEWYVSQLEKGNVPGAKAIREYGSHSFTSKDPTSNTTATTSYKVER